MNAVDVDMIIFSRSDCILLSLFVCMCLYCVSVLGYRSAQLDQSAFLLFITFLLFYVGTVERGMLVMLSHISIGFICNSPISKF